MLTRFKVTCNIAGRTQDDIYNANNPDHACTLAKQHLDSVYPLTKTRIVQVVCIGPEPYGEEPWPKY